MIIAAQLSFRAEPRSGEVEESHSSRQRVVILSARLCENSDFNAIPKKPSLINRAGATISIGGMVLVSPFSPSVRVFTQSRAQDDNELRMTNVRASEPRLQHSRFRTGQPPSRPRDSGAPRSAAR